MLFAAFYDLSAVIPSQFSRIYNFNALQIGLCYIPFGVGSLLASLLNGHLLDRNFRRWAKLSNISIKKGRQQDLSKFPVEKARLQIAIPATYASIAFILVFGWVLSLHHPPLAALLVLLFLTSLFMSAAFNATSTLLIDFYPNSPATATAANNLLRCWVGAGATAAIVPMVEAWGKGWSFTALCAVLILASPGLWAVYFLGMGWRGKREERERTRKMEKELGKRGVGPEIAVAQGTAAVDLEKGNQEQSPAAAGSNSSVDNTVPAREIRSGPTEKSEYSSALHTAPATDEAGDDGIAPLRYDGGASTGWDLRALHRTASHHSTC